MRDRESIDSELRLGRRSCDCGGAGAGRLVALGGRAPGAGGRTPRADPRSAAKSEIALLSPSKKWASRQLAETHLIFITKCHTSTGGSAPDRNPIQQSNKLGKGYLVRKSLIAGVTAVGIAVSACGGGGGGGHSKDWNQGYADGKSSGQEAATFNSVTAKIGQYGFPQAKQTIDESCSSTGNSKDYEAGCRAGWNDGYHPSKPSGGN